MKKQVKFLLVKGKDYCLPFPSYDDWIRYKTQFESQVGEVADLQIYSVTLKPFVEPKNS